MIVPVRIFTAMIFAAALSAQDPAELISQGRPAEAERALAAQLRSRPNDVRALVLMGIALDQQKRFANAEPHYQRAVKLAPAEPAVLNNAGNHYLAAGKEAEAKRMFQRVVAVQPGHPNANLQLAQLAAAAKSGPEVLRALDRLAPDAARAFEVRALRARALAWAGKPEDASRLLKALEAESGGDARRDFSLGLAWAEAKRYEEAEAAFSRALAASRGDRDVLFNLGLAAIGAHQYPRAVQVLELAIRQKPDDVDALYALARAHAEGGNNAMALIPLIAARKVAPRRADVLEFIGHVSDALGYYGDAVAAYDEFLKLKPENDIVRRERAFCLVRMNRMQDGLRDLEWYVAKYPKDPAGLFQLALAESVADPEKALARLNTALALKPDYVSAIFARGSVCLTLNRPADAVPDLERVLQVDADNVRALDRLGQARLHLDQPDKALPLLERAAKLAPNDIKVLAHYSQALRFTGRMDEARTVMARFRQIPEEMRRMVYGGVVDFLSLPPAEQRERYFEGLQRSARINDTNPDLQMRIGHEYLVRKQAREAIEAYRRAVSLEGGSKLVPEIAAKLMDAEEWAAARDFLAPVAAAGSPAMRLDLAISTFHAVSPEAGLAELDRIPAAERQGDYYLVRAQVLDQLGKLEEAVAALNTGFRTAPTRASLYFEAANFLLKHGLHRETADLLEQAIRTVPDAPQLRVSRAIALELMHRTPEALKELETAQRKWPEWDRTYLVQGIILNVDKKPEQARRALETAISLGSDTAEAYYFLALSIFESAPGETRPARRAAEAALELNPSDPYILALAGKFAYTDGDRKTAIDLLSKAVRIFPDYVQAHYNLATVYREGGEEEKAVAEIKEVRRIREGRTKEDLEMLRPPLDAGLFGVGR